MQIQFVKMHGLGNDFVFVEDLEGILELSDDSVARLCDRHMGVGADGLILVRRDPTMDGFYMHYRNSDGSLAEMCGNGIRCFAKYLVDRGLQTGDAFDVGTLGGPKSIRVERDGDGRFLAATVDMGEPILEPSLVPVVVDGEIVQNHPVETPQGIVHITAVSMGNPHAVLFVDDVDAAPVSTLGPFLETHPMFPHKTNVEFVEVCDFEKLCIRVWERGVGETLACGTGACAAVVAASLGCETGRRATVLLPGGELSVEWTAEGPVLMTGSAAEVFTGALELE